MAAALASASSISNPMTKSGKDAALVGVEEDKLVLSLDVLCCTWNVGNTTCETLEPWIPAGGGDYDIIAVAAQECKFTSKWKGETAAEGEEEDEEDEDDAEAHDAAAEAADGHGPSDGKATLARLRTALGKEPSSSSAAAERLSSRDLGATAVKTASEDTEGGEMLGAMATEVSGSNVIDDQESYRALIASQSPFYKMVIDHLGSDWDIVAMTLMFQTGLLVATRKRISKRVTSVAQAQEATGVMRVGTNKGGVLVQVEIAGTRLCFVGAHLAAHLQHCGKRDQDVMEIVGQIRLGGPRLSPIDLDVQAHHVFWMGDLNYRVDWDSLATLKNKKAAAASGGEGAKAFERVKTEKAERVERTEERIAAKDWAGLYEADQLRMQMEQGYIFSGFSELPLAFPPTFKVKKTSALEYKAKRVPSYCDRVLFKSIPRLASKLTPGTLSAHPTVPTSDHKPVSCDFKVECVKGASMLLEPPLPPAPPAITEPAPDAPPPLSRAVSAPITELYVVRFHNVRGSNLVPMDWGGLSDPYIRFYSDPSEVIVPTSGGMQPRSRHVAKTLDPEWPDDGIPDLVLAAETLDDVAKCHIFLAVVDHDDLDADDSMGQAVLSLEPAVQALLASDSGAGSSLLAATNCSAEDPAEAASASEPHRARFCLPVTQATSNLCPVRSGKRPVIMGEVEIIRPGSKLRLRASAKESLSCCCNCDACCTVM